MLGVAAEAGALDVLSEMFEGYAWMAWSGQGPGSQPWGLAEALLRAQRAQRWRAGSHLGDLLGRGYPDCALGPYAAAHFRERGALARPDPDVAEGAGARARRFGRARTLAERAGEDALAAHCALRQGTALLLGRGRPEGGRALLRELDAGALPPTERLWYAMGMSRSDFWLDRVRAADAVDELATEVLRARPGEASRQLTGEQMERAARFVLERDAGELADAEEDRLRALVDLIFEGDTLERDRLHQQLDVRQSLQGADEAQTKALLEGLARRAPELGESWRLSVRSAQLLLAWADPTRPVDALPAIPDRAPEDAPWLELSHLALELLGGGRRDEAAEIELALQSLRAALRADPSRPPAWMTGLAVAWPQLIAWIEEHAPPRKKRRGGPTTTRSTTRSARAASATPSSAS